MIEVAIMIEGQNGLTWERWQKIAAATEDLGFVGLYRSDHYTNASPPDKESLELWISLAWLASHTKKIEFGPMVSPVSFREPTMTARMARDVDDLSGGRLHLGLGAGWQEREHDNYGHDLLDIPERFTRFTEGIEVISQLLQSDEPVDFDGDYYDLTEAVLLPRPQRPGGPPILIGGNGPKRTLPLVAKYAQEWNSLFLTAEGFAELNSQLDQMLENEGRQSSDVRRSMMNGLEYGRDDADVRERVEKRTQGKRTVEEWTALGPIAGTGNQIVDQLGKLAEAGVQRVMLQWLDLDDVDRLEAMAKEILPQLHG
ncbi:MAG: TIGR03560 family F420-dependent LLM class oxidoreductase [Chloroflexi bacterium]|nr:MAG: TIGR03560 family F420-dependent LLM class oxidoreductase [Chloroflexota bacterium]MBL1196037.1 TIGR03560 family F420-dependent LLM class oxidoreductase [Chloroflexota bacterium]NOH13331.1 TIGR03560 family F420-dependent LLM class oxidoreductase [Chloroflexota bacterium]